MSAGNASESSVLSSDSASVAQSHSGTGVLTSCCVCTTLTPALLLGSAADGEVTEDIKFKCAECMLGASDATTSLAAAEHGERDSALLDALEAMGVVSEPMRTEPPAVLFSSVLQAKDNILVAESAAVQNRGVAVSDAVVVASALPAGIIATVGAGVVDDAKYAKKDDEPPAVDEAVGEQATDASVPSFKPSAHQAAIEAQLSKQSANKVAAEFAKIREAEARADARTKQAEQIKTGLQALALPLATAQMRLKAAQNKTAEMQSQAKKDKADLEAKQEAALKAFVAKQKEEAAALAKSQEASAKELEAEQKKAIAVLAEIRREKQALEHEQFALNKKEHELRTGVAQVRAASVASAVHSRSILSAVQEDGIDVSSSSSSSSSSAAAASSSSAVPHPPAEGPWMCNGWSCEKPAVIAKLTEELAKAEHAHGKDSPRARMLGTLLRRAKRVESEEQLYYVVRAATERRPFCRFGTQKACPFERCSFVHAPPPPAAPRTSSRNRSSGAGVGVGAPVGASVGASVGAPAGAPAGAVHSSSSSSSSNKVSRPSKTAARRAKQRAEKSSLERQVADLKEQVEALAQQQQQ